MKGKQDNKSKELDYWENTSLLGKLERPVLRYDKTKRTSFFVGFEFHIRRGSVFFLYVLVGRCWVYITMPATKAKLKKNIVSKTPISLLFFWVVANQ